MSPQGVTDTLPELGWTPWQGGHGGQGTGCEQAGGPPSVSRTRDFPIGRGSPGRDRRGGAGRQEVHVTALPLSSVRGVTTGSLPGPHVSAHPPGGVRAALLTLAHVTPHTGAPWPGLPRMVAARSAAHPRILHPSDRRPPSRPAPAHPSSGDPSVHPSTARRGRNGEQNETKIPTPTELPL